MTDDQLEAEMLSAAAASLRRRADRQRDIAARHGPGSGESAVALRLAAEFDELAEEFAASPASPCA
jgi:hypothetical protein